MNAEPINAKPFFLNALEIASAAERQAYVEAQCGADEPLRREVEQLLQHHAAQGSFLESPAHAPTATVDLPVATERPGTVIGPYKLLQQIGEGGFGVVFMAEQTQPVQRKVALKVIKPGMDSHLVIVRFEAERQALAMMDHVNIARVFDAGATESGRPYFVMELVHGVPITKYCDDNRLTPRERLELFVPVCHAIQHAHQKGIIHRDIKPSNIMTTLYDGKPVPKVIDFGVAKATEQRLTERTLFTQFGTMVGTLEYMSPEQAEMSALGADTRSDIYSLGVLLYELLTGSTPLSRKRFKEAAYAEVLRMIKEEEPPKPSTRLSDSGEALASISAQRHMEPAKLTKLMRGELDWIVMKTLEKDRNRRYETASAFAADVQRYLDDEPVQACPPSARYRLRKFARRNRGAVLAGTIVVVALLAGAAVSTWQAVRATQAGHDAKAANDRLQDNLALSLKSLDEIYLQVLEDRMPREGEAARENQEFLSKALSFYEQFAERNESDPKVRREVASAYDRAGVLQMRIGHTEKGLAALDRAEGVAARFVADYPAEMAPKLLLAEIHLHRGKLAFVHGGQIPALQSKAAPEEYRKGIELLEPMLGTADVSPKCLETLSMLHHSLGYYLFDKIGAVEAEKQYRQAIKLRRRLVDEVDDLATKLYYTQQLSETHLNLGYLLGENLLLDEGEDELHQTIALLTQVQAQAPGVAGFQRGRLPGFPGSRPLSDDLGCAHWNLGLILAQKGRSRAAEVELGQATAYYTQAAKDWPGEPLFRRRLAAAKRTYGQGLFESGKLTEARGQLRESLEILRKLDTESPGLEENQHFLAHSLRFMGDLLRAQGETEKAAQHYRELRDLRETMLASSPDDSGFIHDVAWFLVCCADPSFWDPPRAVALAQKAVDQHPQSAWKLRTLGIALYRQDQWLAAVDSLKKASRLRFDRDEGAWLFLAMAHMRLGEKDAARACYDRAEQLMSVFENPREESLRWRTEAAALLGIEEQKLKLEK